MDKITANFTVETGPVKPLHATNNGPVHKFHINEHTASNLDAFIDAGIPFCRTHDAAFYADYGGEHTVDVNNIFTDWSADPYDPASYDFACTDEYMKCINACGAKIFYRLGSKIEHWVKKYNTAVPKDFNKWAIVAEHIIRHYTEGWADGFNYEGTYWEIWNEPDLDNDDSVNKRCWQGTCEQFIEFYNVVFNHLRRCFPKLKIGGPAVADLGKHVRGSNNPEIEGKEWLDVFFDRIDQKPDFLSWHVYSATVEKVIRKIRQAKDYLDRHGMSDVASILNEWNYVRGWENEDWFHSKKTWKSLKGGAFAASVMEMSQYEPVDMLMYYDARPCGMNCLFDADEVYNKRKGYYSFYAFNHLYKLGAAVEVKRESEDVWAVAAKGEDGNAVMLTYYKDETDVAEKTVKVEFNGVKSENGVRLEYYLVDEKHDFELIREEIFTAKDFAAYVKMPLYSTYLLKAVKL